MNIQVKVMVTQRFDLIVSQDGVEDLRYDGAKVERLPDAVLPRLGAKIDYFGVCTHFAIFYTVITYWLSRLTHGLHSHTLYIHV